MATPHVAGAAALLKSLHHDWTPAQIKLALMNNATLLHDEIMAGGLDTYLDAILRQCGQVHGAMYQTYVSYPIEAALEA